MSGGIDFNHEEASDALSRPDRPRTPLTARLRTTMVLGAAVAALAVMQVSATTAPSAAPGAPAAETPRGGSTTAGERRRPVLENVRGLDKPVTYTETKIPLGELIQKVAADTGAPLTVAPGVADEPVEVIVNDLPAANCSSSSRAGR